MSLTFGYIIIKAGTDGSPVAFSRFVPTAGRTSFQSGKQLSKPDLEAKFVTRAEAWEGVAIYVNQQETWDVIDELNKRLGERHELMQLTSGFVAWERPD